VLEIHRECVDCSFLSKLLNQKYEFTRSVFELRVRTSGIFCPHRTKEFEMRLSTKSRFAVTAMIDVALRETQGPVALAAISARQHISLSYLEQLFSKLRKASLVESTRGPGGGYTLARDAHAVSVADIISAVDADGSHHPDQHQDVDGSSLLTHDLWNNLNQKMVDHLSSITLRQLMEESLAKGTHVEARPAAKRGIFTQRDAKPFKVNAPNSVFALGAALATSR
jgi:Rrf2 family iron-sulfur cluster assembly transcriptional regulator